MTMQRMHMSAGKRTPAKHSLLRQRAPCCIDGHSATAARHLRSWLAGLAALLAASAAVAATIPTSPTFSVNASIVQGCIVFGGSSQTSGIPFGAINFGSHPALNTGVVNAMAGSSMGTQAQLVCTPGTTVQISVNGGLHPVGSQRRLSNGAGKYIPYSLSLMQGTPTALPPNAAVGITTDGTPTALPLRGTVALPGTGIAAGIYTDTLQVVVSW